MTVGRPDQMARRASRAVTINSLAVRGLALPRVARITWPTRNFAAAGLPPR